MTPILNAFSSGLEVGEKKYRYDTFPSLPFPLSAPPFPILPFLTLSLLFPLFFSPAVPLKVGPLNPARTSEGAL